MHELSILLFIGLFMKSMTFILQRKASGQENSDDDFGVEDEIASHDNNNNNSNDDNDGDSDTEIIRVMVMMTCFRLQMKRKRPPFVSSMAWNMQERTHKR